MTHDPQELPYKDVQGQFRFPLRGFTLRAELKAKRRDWGLKIKGGTKECLISGKSGSGSISSHCPPARRPAIWAPGQVRTTPAESQEEEEGPGAARVPRHQPASQRGSPPARQPPSEAAPTPARQPPRPSVHSASRGQCAGPFNAPGIYND